MIFRFHVNVAGCIHHDFCHMILILVSSPSHRLPSWVTTTYSLPFGTFEDDDISNFPFGGTC